MFKIKTIIILFFILVFTTVSFTDVKTDLQNRKKELNKLHTNISNKKAEKEKLVKEEKKVKQELKNILNSIKKNEHELNVLQEKIVNTEKELSFASNRYSDSDYEKQEYAKIINEQILSYIKNKTVSFFDNSLYFKIKQIYLKDSFDKYMVAKNKTILAQTDINKFTQAKNNYEKLKVKQQELVKKNKKLQQDKNNLLKTTAGKRVKAEQDIKDLYNSEKALKALVDKLIKASQHKDTKRKIVSTNTRKNNLPWPLNGKIILNYGKNKHPDLNTNVISNGIKIKAQDYAVVKSVEEGNVIFAGEFRSYGKMIILDHKGVFFSFYCQLNKILVKENQKVIKQQDIATVGKDENSVLYFEIRQYNISEDPLLWLKEKK